MTESKTPLIPERDGYQKLYAYTPYLYSSRRFTPGTAQYSQGKRSRKLKAPLNESEESVEFYDYTGLLKKTWKVYSVSPLYNFNANLLAFKKYSRSLDAALTEDKSFANAEESLVKSSFSIYKGLNFGKDDPEAVQIQITEKVLGEGRSSSAVVLTALLICVDVENKPVQASLGEHFTYYPVILVTGNKLRSNILLNWLERHFDCHTSPLTFSNNDLRWMLTCWSTKDAGHKAAPVLMQYSLQNVSESLSTIQYQCDSLFCRDLLSRIKDGSLDNLTSIDEDDVEKFVDALESHHEYAMNIVFSKLPLLEVGTPVAYVSNQGKIKMFISDGVFLSLHLLCTIANEKFSEWASVWKKPVPV